MWPSGALLGIFFAHCMLRGSIVTSTPCSFASFYHSRLLRPILKAMHQMYGKDSCPDNTASSTIRLRWDCSRWVGRCRPYLRLTLGGNRGQVLSNKSYRVRRRMRTTRCRCGGRPSGRRAGRHVTTVLLSVGLLSKEGVTLDGVVRT